MGKISKFEHDLGQGWKLIQQVDDKGNETFDFTGGNAHIRLGNDSVKRLRDILNKHK